MFEARDVMVAGRCHLFDLRIKYFDRHHNKP